MDGCRVRFDGGFGGLNPLAHNADPPSLLEISTPGGRIIQAFNPPVQYFQHILASIVLFTYTYCSLLCGVSLYITNLVILIYPYINVYSSDIVSATCIPR